MNDAKSEPALVKKRELARSLGVSTRTVDGWVAKRLVPYLAPSPRLHLFDVAAVKLALTAAFGIEARKA